MYSKIALKSVKQNFKDYAIYFVTITFAICIFYSFNSIDAQSAIANISSIQEPYVDILLKIISIISAFVTLVFSGLIVYSNKFLIAKRNKEFAIYMTLGMRKRAIAGILVMETLIIGVVSGIIGILFGVLMSQGLSLFTARLFDVSVESYSFVFSIGAVKKTLLYFCLIFILVLAFNIMTITKLRLIDLLQSSKKNEIVLVNSSKKASVIFIIGTFLIGIAYTTIKQNGLNIDSIFIMGIIFLFIGTFMFFYGLGTIALHIIKKRNTIFYKNVNLFVLKQLSNKINTNFISMTFICFMLFFSIIVLSLGLGFKNVIESSRDDVMPFDASITVAATTDEDNKYQVVDEITSINEQSLENMQRVIIYQYTKNIQSNTLIKEYIPQIDEINIISISDYNRLQEFKNGKPINLEENEILITSNQEPIKQLAQDMIDHNESIDFNNVNYRIKNKEVIPEAFYTDEFLTNSLTVIVPEQLTSSLVPDQAHINIDYRNDLSQEEELRNIINNIEKKEEKYSASIVGVTKEQLIEDSKGLTTVVLYVDIYLGIIFMLSSAALLAIQLLSEAGESVVRFQALKRIGASNKMIRKSIFVQLVIYFMVPLMVASAHALIGINIAMDFFREYGDTNITSAVLITMLLLVIIYGGYFFATFTSYNRIIQKSI